MTVVHSGARDAYQVALALEEAGMLDTLVTDLFWPSDCSWAEHLLRRLPSSLRDQLHARSSAGIPWSKTRLCALSGVATLLLDKLPGVPTAIRRNMMRKTDATLGRTAAEIATHNHTGLLSYSYYAHDAFTKFRGDSILFQLHPHPASMRRILLKELEAHPQCEVSLSQEWELSLPESDFQHLVGETGMARRILAASSFTKATLVENGISKDNIQVIPYGVDTTRFYPDSNRQRSVRDKLRLLFVGRINQRKGIQYLVEALRIVGIKNVELTICGRVVDDLSIFKPLNGSIIIRPNVSIAELVDAYQSADLFVLPSVAEGFGQVLLEALASGLPILSTTRTAAPDLIESGVEGFIIDPCNAEQLASSIDWCLSNRPALQAMRNAARQAAQHFTWSRFRRDLIAAINGESSSASSPSHISTGAQRLMPQREQSL